MQVPKFFWVIIALLVLVFMLLGFLALRGQEDTWRCQAGQWVKHGNPSASQPTTPCP